MDSNIAILCINGSDSSGHSGIQSDIKTVKDLGGFAVTAVTSVTIQNQTGIKSILNMPAAVVNGQIKAVYDDIKPRAVKVGLIDDAEAIEGIRREIVGCRQIVCSLSILSSQGGELMTKSSVEAYRRHLIPISTLLMLKCKDAELLLGHSINTDDDMEWAAGELLKMGAQWVLLRGGTYIEGRINALLVGPEHKQFFSSINIDGWKKHGIGGALSTAIATRLAMGDEMSMAVRIAHDYIHTQLVYSTDRKKSNLRPNELYETFLSLITNNYNKFHDVATYAERMSITTRYLSQITNETSGRAPKAIIDSYLLSESERLLTTTTLTIQEIANRLGFSSQVIFTKFFKAKKGVPPKESRIMHNAQFIIHN